jgi:hypothetical protein
MKVICDTMIWYGLANGSIILDEENEIELIATGVTIQELSSSENLYKNPNLIKGALNAMQKYHSQIIEYDPWDYILTFNVNLEYEPISRDWHINNLNGFSTFMKGDLDNLFKDEIEVNKLTELIFEWNQSLIEFTDSMNLGLDTIRANRSQKFITKKDNQLDLEDGQLKIEIMFMLIDIIAKRLNLKVEDVKDKIDFSNLELLIEMWEMYWIDKLKMQNSKFHVNDIFDLLNMAYVSAEDKYWTLEKNPWLRLLNSNGSTSKYIFSYEK